MNKKEKSIQDLADIRSMMERSSKFLSLSGWAGIMAGMYALAGAWIAYSVYRFNPDQIIYSSSNQSKVMMLALLVLILALITAIWFSRQKALKNGQKIWNATSRRLLISMAIPLSAGGGLILVCVTKGLIGLIAPSMLLFYGLALYNAGFYTIPEVRVMGLVQMGLGLISAWFTEYSMLLWAVGFGVVHIIYGVYMYFRYER